MGAVEIPLGEIAPSPFNPRKSFDAAKLEELAASIRAQGVLQPVLVRPATGTGHELLEIDYELVLGERRVRAARLAGLETIPAVVRPMEDADVVEAQVIENDQREGVSPLEEADGYQLLMEKFGRSVEEIAAKTGRSKAYVYARLKLTALGAKGRKALVAGELSPATALYVARLPEKLQASALERLSPRSGREGEVIPLTAREAAGIIREHFMRALGKAPFDPADAGLVKGVGACGACPKRTGNQPDLFGEVDSADVCTDPACFRKKADAAWKPRAAAERVKGHTVIDGAPAKKLTRDTFVGGTQLTYSSNLVSVTDTTHIEGKGTVRVSSLLPKGAPLTIIRAEDGTVIRAVPRETVAKLVRAARPKKAKDPKETARKREEKARAEIAEAVLDRARLEVVALAESGGVPNLWRLLIAAATTTVSFPWQDAVMRRRCPDREWEDPEDTDVALQALAGELDEAGQRGLLAELLIANVGGWRGEEEVRETFAAWGVDLEAIEAQVAAELAPAPAEKPARKKRAKAAAVQG